MRLHRVTTDSLTIRTPQIVTPVVKPVCRMCGERGIHGTADDCLDALRKAVQIAKGSQAA